MRIAPNIRCTSHLTDSVFFSFSKFQASMAVEILQFVQPWYESEESGFETSDTCEKHIRHLQSWSRRPARAHFRIEQRLRCQERPDSESSDGGPTSESDSDDLISVTSCSKQVHQSQHHRGVNGQTNLARITSGSIHKVRGTQQIITLRSVS